jgi:hypothetical protein
MISKFTLALSFRQNGQLEERLYHFDQQFAVPAVGEVIALPDRNPHDSEFLTVQRRHFALFAGKDGDWDLPSHLVLRGGSTRERKVKR